MKIGILQAGHAPDELQPTHGTYSDLFHKLLDGHGFSFTTFSVVDMEFPTSPQECDGWLITGSKHGTYEDLPFIAPLEDLIRAIYATDRPLVGICFGHQIIAQALGGKVEKFKDGWAVGRQTYDWDGQAVALNAWHQDQVVSLPDDAEVLSGNAFCKNAALIYQKKAFTVQPHPEFENDFTGQLSAIRGKGVVPDPLLEAMRQDLDKPIDNGLLAQKIAQFFLERHVA